MLKLSWICFSCAFMSTVVQFLTRSWCNRRIGIE